MYIEFSLLISFFPGSQFSYDQLINIIALILRQMY